MDIQTPGVDVDDVVFQNGTPGIDVDI